MHRRGRSQLPHQLIDADRTTASHIVDFADFVTIGDRYQSVDGIADEGKIPCLLAIADDRKRLAGQKLGEKNSEHGAICAARARARTVNVEEADGDGRAADTRPPNA